MKSEINASELPRKYDDKNAYWKFFYFIRFSKIGEKIKQVEPKQYLSKSKIVDNIFLDMRILI